MGNGNLTVDTLQGGSSFPPFPARIGILNVGRMEENQRIWKKPLEDENLQQTQTQNMNHSSGRRVLSPLAIPNPHNNILHYYGIDIVLHFLRVVYIFKFYFKMSLKFVYSGNHHEFSIAMWPI